MQLNIFESIITQRCHAQTVPESEPTSSGDIDILNGKTLLMWHLISLSSYSLYKKERVTNTREMRSSGCGEKASMAQIVRGFERDQH